jgi:type I restriction enzyme R subunit
VAENGKPNLLTLVTGSGKTFIACQIAWKLFHARWNLSGEPTRRPRILFLADRNILANQAYNQFSAFPEDAMVRIAPDQIRKKGKVPKNGSLFFTIFQTFMASTGSATEKGSATEEGSATGRPASADLPDVTEIRDAYGYMYILECSDGSLYVGSTRELRLRIEQHSLGEGSRHTAAHRPIRLVYYECFDRIDEAFQREKQVQGWSRAKKVALITGRNDLLPRLSRRSPVAEPVEAFGEYPPDFFDFIIIDECHRGGANDESNWRGIMEHFSPAVQLGLTATPKRKDNVDTYAYFGEPVYIYSLKDGINDGFLTPFKVRQIQTTLDEYIYTPDDNVVEGEIETGKTYEEKDFNKIIEIKEREAHRVKLFLEQINQSEKTLVFCATQTHALAVRDLINQMKESDDPNYCQRVTANDGALGEQHLRDFQDNEKTIPTILTTSQKLSTGVDARNIRNIVLMRPVNSIIEFKQIVGRGTRLYDGKDYFTIYDFVKAYQHFNDPEWDGEPAEPEPVEPRPPKEPGDPSDGPVDPPPPKPPAH